MQAYLAVTDHGFCLGLERRQNSVKLAKGSQSSYSWPADIGLPVWKILLEIVDWNRASGYWEIMLRWSRGDVLRMDINEE